MLTQSRIRSALLLMTFSATVMISGCAQAQQSGAQTPVSSSATESSPRSPTASKSSPANDASNATPKGTAEKWLHAIGARDFTTACQLYNPDGQMFQVMGGISACKNSLAAVHPKSADRLGHAVVDRNAITAQGETATIPLKAVKIDGAPWSNDWNGTFMTLLHRANGWYIRDLTDVTIVTARTSGQR